MISFYQKTTWDFKKAYLQNKKESEKNLSTTILESLKEIINTISNFQVGNSEKFYNISTLDFYLNELNFLDHTGITPEPLFFKYFHNTLYKNSVLGNLYMLKDKYSRIRSSFITINNTFVKIKNNPEFYDSFCNLTTLLVELGQNLGLMAGNYIHFYLKQLKIFNGVITSFLILDFIFIIILITMTIIFFCKKFEIYKILITIFQSIIIVLIICGIIFWSCLGCFFSVTLEAKNVLQYFQKHLPTKNFEIMYNFINNGTNLMGTNNDIETFKQLIEMIEETPNVWNKFSGEPEYKNYLKNITEQINDTLSDLNSIRNSDGTTLGDISLECGQNIIDGDTSCTCKKCSYLDSIQNIITTLKNVNETNSLEFGFDAIFNELNSYQTVFNDSLSKLNEIFIKLEQLPQNYLPDIFNCTNIKISLDNFISLPIENGNEIVPYLMVNSVILFLILVFCLYISNNVWDSCSETGEVVNSSEMQNTHKKTSINQQSQNKIHDEQEPPETERINIQRQFSDNQNSKLSQKELDSHQDNSKNSENISTNLPSKQKSNNFVSTIVQSKINLQLKEKEIDTQTQTIISSIMFHSEIQNFEGNEISSFIQLIDGRILSGTVTGDMYLSSINLNGKSWNCESTFKNAHKDSITSFCELNDLQLISGSMDTTIKVWSLSQNKFTLLSTLTKHTDGIFKVIPLINSSNFLSCSADYTIRIWNSSKPYKEKYTIHEDKSVYLVIELKNHKDTIITCCRNLRTDYACYIGVWDLIEYNQGNKTPKQLDCKSRVNSLIEISNNLIAAVTTKENCTVMLIHPINLTIVKQIGIEGFDGSISILSMFDKHSFLCICDGQLVQMIDSEIVYTSEKNNNNFDGRAGLLIDIHYKYIIGKNTKGFCILEILHK